jgi:hypothetical protein
MRVFKTTQIAGLPIMFGAVYLASIDPNVSHLPRPLLALPVWFIAYIAVGIWLNRFRCPRCGKLYYWRVELKGYIERQTKWRDCRHCGLPQDTGPA